MTDNEQYDYLQKIVMIGDANVGKTHLMSRYIRGTLPQHAVSTIGLEFATRTVPLASGGVVKAQIWDTAGQERYRAIAGAHYRRASGALIVYDVTRLDTFSHCANWLSELRDIAEPDIVIMLVGNKVDLVERDPSRRQVPTEEAAKWAQEEGLFFCETSATTAHNVKHCFERLVQEIYNIQSKQCLEDRDVLHLGSGVKMQESRAQQNQNQPCTLGGNFQSGCQ